MRTSVSVTDGGWADSVACRIESLRIARVRLRRAIATCDVDAPLHLDGFESAVAIPCGCTAVWPWGNDGSNGGVARAPHSSQSLYRMCHVPSFRFALARCDVPWKLPCLHTHTPY